VTTTRHFVELKACGPDDPDGSRTATILSAYFHAEHVKAFRQLLWRRLAILASIWSAVAMTTSVLSRGATTVFFAIVGGVACWAAVLAWSADHRVAALLADSQATQRPTET
jgi:hypothetical protein